MKTNEFINRVMSCKAIIFGPMLAGIYGFTVVVLGVTWPVWLSILVIFISLPLSYWVVISGWIKFYKELKQRQENYGPMTIRKPKKENK